MDAEKTIMFLEGVNGQLYLYEDRLHITRKGIMANGTHNIKDWKYYHTQLREKEKTIYFYQIQKIELRKAVIPLTNGYIRFVTADARAVKNIFEAAQDDNTVMFSILRQTTALQIQRYIEEYLMKQ